jgi:hypothetical protein
LPPPSARSSAPSVAPEQSRAFAAARRIVPAPPVRARRHGATPSISVSSEKLRNVLITTISPSTRTLSTVGAIATVSLGRRLVQRVFGSRREDEPLSGPLAVLADDPADGDALAAVRLAIRQALAGDPALQAEIRSMLPRAPGVTQHVHAGRDAYTAGGDQTIVHYRHPGD